MNTKEKIALAANTDEIYLHKEGIFYKLYNQHAMLFTQNIKALKVKAGFIKAVNQVVYSCGFPATILDDVKAHMSEHGGEILESGQLLTVGKMNWQTPGDYIAWCLHHKEEAAASENGTISALTHIEKQIIAFPVMRSTPMDAMNFIIGLQEELQQRQL